MCLVFFFNDTATTEIYTLSLHDALPILLPAVEEGLIALIGATTENPYFEVNSALVSRAQVYEFRKLEDADVLADRKSTRLNSSHANISYAVFCLKKQ